jgi:antitoxin (DNA-binding transcriptional repressor) of toxin-antitoxin stability system
MQQMPISEFKAHCLAVLEKVRRSGEPLLVTRFGKPVARIEAPEKPEAPDWIGCMEGSAVYGEDIKDPAAGPEQWDVLK